MSENLLFTAQFTTHGLIANGLISCLRADFLDGISFLSSLFSKFMGIVGYDHIYPLKPKNPI
ncbi:hypothetical protein [Algoriphagus sp.]|uniref:hypothetical protein n=1 Tax=Algoriphagus sp. TaxID=1872435 RepID=UPI0027262DB4|nr:hypothetical protein [Algoriphagus sp.]MDO8965738.1 hypothetical protein [Algoriphagus sp.]MDP3198833.1 hypothetical protein [Algoriphagus sp.]